MSIREIQARASALAKTPKARPSVTSTASPTIPFPHMSDEQFVAPNISLRSALFGVSKSGRRRVIRERIAAQEGYEIFYDGETLNQFDEDVWLVVLRHARREGMGVDIFYTMRGLCRALQWPYGGRSIARLERTLSRLTKASVELRGRNLLFIGHLIDFMGHDEVTGKLYLRLNPEMGSLFNSDQYTYLASNRRLSFHGYLAKWLDGYYASHAKPYAVKVETLHTW
jgi:hypothetical protein